MWPFFKWKPASFNFFALSIGSIIPDLECPFLFPFVSDRWHARWVMHSLVGAVTIDLLLSVLLVLYFVPGMMRYLDGKVNDKGYFSFAGIDLRKHRTAMTTVIGSAMLGSVSHVLIDTLHHPYNPLTFPFPQYYGFNLVLFGDLTVSGIIMQGGTLLLLMSMLYWWYFRPLRKNATSGKGPGK